jgi:hypothetical protein
VPPLRFSKIVVFVDGPCLRCTNELVVAVGPAFTLGLGVGVNLGVALGVGVGVADFRGIGLELGDAFGASTKSTVD